MQGIDHSRITQEALETEDAFFFFSVVRPFSFVILKKDFPFPSSCLFRHHSRSLREDLDEKDIYIYKSGEDNARSSLSPGRLLTSKQ